MGDVLEQAAQQAQKDAFVEHVRRILLAELSLVRVDVAALALEPMVRELRTMVTELQRRPVASKRKPELEVRFGTWDPEKHRFVSGVTIDFFRQILHEIASASWDEVTPGRELTDTFYQANGYTVRTTTECKQGRLEIAHIRKEAVASVVFQAAMQNGRRHAGFDLRASLATEIPVSGLPDIVTTTHVRIKQRTEYRLGPLTWMFTVVWGGKTHADAETNQRLGQSTAYEIELEVTDADRFCAMPVEPPELVAVAEAAGDLRGAADMLKKSRDFVRLSVLDFAWTPVVQ